MNSGTTEFIFSSRAVAVIETSPVATIAELPMMTSASLLPMPSGRRGLTSDDTRSAFSVILFPESDAFSPIVTTRSDKKISVISSVGELFVNYENVLVQPIQSNPSGLVSETDTGYATVMFPWEINYSPRVTFGYSAPEGKLGWRARYWQFHHHQAFFTSSIRTDVIDLEVSRNLSDPVEVFVGLRHGRFAHSYSAVTPNNWLYAESEFRGIGPTMAMQLTHQLPLNRLALFANVRGALMYGQKEFRGIDDDTAKSQHINGIDLRSFDEGADSFAGSAEMQIGVQYKMSDCFLVRVAFEGQHYAGVGGPHKSRARGPLI